MWTVIFITQLRETAETLKKLLRDAGLLVKVRSIGANGVGQYGCYEILLPESEVEEGHSILIDNLIH